MKPVENPDHQSAEKLVEHKVRRTVAKKVLHDISQQVEEIEREVSDEKKRTRYLIPVIVVALLLFILLFNLPDLLRQVSGWMQAG